METTNDKLNQIREEMASVVGPDLADSLVRAGRKRGQFDLDMQLAINDGLEQLSREKREKAVALIDSLIRSN